MAKKSKKRICQKCAHPNKARTRRCESCDWDLSKKPIPLQDKIYLIIIGFLILLVILLPTKVEKYQEEVPYLKTIHSTEQVPYDKIQEEVVQVPYKEQEIYFDRVCANPKIAYTYEFVECSRYNGISSVKISNVDSAKGFFEVKIGYKDLNDVFIYSTQSKTIYAHQAAIFTYSSIPYNSFKNCYYWIDKIPTKEVCVSEKKSRTVTKYRTETKYNTITDYRLEKKQTQVMKTRNETNLREVNWLFGFDALIKFKTLN